MREMFLSPHNDDESLFGAFTILRHKPSVYFVTRSVKQAERGITYQQRDEESRQALQVLGAEIQFLNIPEPELDVYKLTNILKEINSKRKIKVVYAPAFQGGHNHHDIVCLAAEKVFGNKVIHYATYTKYNLTPKGNIELFPTKEELDFKNRALACYRSQLPWNHRHFDAVKDKSEYWIE